MAYDGLGNRLEMTAYAEGQSVTTRYVLDNGQVMAAIAGESSTFYLYSNGPLAERADAWAYPLTDGSRTARQLVDSTGNVVLASSYTPWGDTLSLSGSGSFLTGYFGGIMDSATGLLYVGNGQYYDPATGRFLNRNARPNQANPYVPWSGDPLGAMMAPLAVLTVVLGKKKKHGKWEVIIILAVLCFTAGMSLSACTKTTQTPPPPPPTQTNPNPQQGAATQTGTAPAATSSPTASPTYGCTPSVAPTPALSPTEIPTSKPTISVSKLWMMMIEFDFGIKMSEVDQWGYKTKKWDDANLQLVYRSLNVINNALNGKLKSIVSGATFLLREHEGSDGEYYGKTHLVEPTGVDFYTLGSQALRQMNIFHEVGHLLDNVPGMWNVFTNAVDYEEGPSWVSNDIISARALKSDYIYDDPNYDQVQARQTFSHYGPSEQWADAFANFVARNINMNNPEGMDMYNFITRVLKPYIGEDTWLERILL